MLHDRHVLDWNDFLLQIKQKEIDSMLILSATTAGNLGAMLRSCTLLDMSPVCILGGASRAFLDKAFRFSMLEQRNHWTSQVVSVEAQRTQEALKELKEAGVLLIGLVAEAPYVEEKPLEKLWDLDLSQVGPLAFVFGSDIEDGLPFLEGVEELLDVFATVPMKQFQETSCRVPDTLNLSAAAAIVAYERQRQLQRVSLWQRLKRLAKSWIQKKFLFKEPLGYSFYQFLFIFPVTKDCFWGGTAYTATVAIFDS